MLHRHLLAASTHYIKLEQNNSKLFFFLLYTVVKPREKEFACMGGMSFPPIHGNNTNPRN